MKNLRLVLLGFLLLGFTASMAQLEKGNLLVGGNAGFNIQFADGDDNLFSISLNPNILSFATDNIAVGGRLGLTYSKSGDFSLTSMTLLPSARYYFASTGSPVFFVDAGLGLSLVSVGFDGDSNSETAFTFAFGPGVALFLSEDVSLDFSLSYLRIGGDFTQSAVNFNVGFQVFLGGGE